MNDKLRELMFEAGYAAPELAERAQRLSELIIRECAKVSMRTGFLNDAEFEGDMIADAIKEHFGVGL